MLCSDARGSLVTPAVYAVERFGGVQASFAAFLWGCAAPSPIRFFGWLLVQRRVNTRDVLLRKTIVTTEGAACPVCSCELETADHMVFECPFARSFWRAVGVDVVDKGYQVGALQALDVRGVVGDIACATFALLCCWQLWKHRNVVVFRGAVPSLARLLACCREDSALWRGRLKVAERSCVDRWLQVFSYPGR
ncbi:uncharacterized protein [Aegilops tauschii subsp. strangulata]|uniref:uncharacterized protein n=1 Tax=Aegilops tauschii subsp. strangulata TaxID=200361 RepID=UPI003CC8DC02